MTAAELVVMVAVASIASGLGAIAGGTSLFTVPTLIVLGVDPHTAVATNIAGLTALSGAAAARLARAGALSARPALPLAAMSLPAGALGAAAALSMSVLALEVVIGVAMLGLALFLAARPQFGRAPSHPSRRLLVLGYALALALGIYSGLFSGGYATLLTFVCVACFGTSLLEGIAATKVVNLVSSGAAAIVFAFAGAIDWTLAAVLLPSMAAGGLAGASLAARVSGGSLHRLLVLAILALGIVMVVRSLGGLPEAT